MPSIPELANRLVAACRDGNADQGHIIDAITERINRQPAAEDAASALPPLFAALNEALQDQSSQALPLESIPPLAAAATLIGTVATPSPHHIQIILQAFERTLPGALAYAVHCSHSPRQPLRQTDLPHAAISYHTLQAIAPLLCLAAAVDPHAHQELVHDPRTAEILDTIAFHSPPLAQTRTILRESCQQQPNHAAAEAAVRALAAQNPRQTYQQ